MHDAHRPHATGAILHRLAGVAGLFLLAAPAVWAWPDHPRFLLFYAGWFLIGALVALLLGMFVTYRER